MPIISMNLDECLTFIRQTDGRPFRIEFEKRTPPHELRVMNATTRAPEQAIASMSGTGMAYDPNAKGLMVVWDLDKESWRMIPTEGIKRIHTAGGWAAVLPDQPE